MSLPPTRIPPSAMDLRQWGSYAMAQRAIPPQDVHFFIPTTYVGFSVDPSGSLAYADLGELVLVWVPETLFGTSNSTTFQIGGLPAAIRPSDIQRLVFWGLDNGGRVLAEAEINTIGDIVFNKAAVSGTDITPGGSWTGAGNKGLIAGTFFLYPK